jgi:hypothetical protein
VLTATGLVVLGLIGHEIMMAKNAEDWEEYARRLGAIDWRRSAEHWQGVLVNNGKMITTQPATKAAVSKVRELIGWSPDLGIPNALSVLDLSVARRSVQVLHPLMPASSRLRVRSSKPRRSGRRDLHAASAFFKCRPRRLHDHQTSFGPLDYGGYQYVTGLRPRKFQ